MSAGEGIVKICFFLCGVLWLQSRNLFGRARLMSLSDRQFENWCLFFSHLEVIYGGQYNAFWLEYGSFRWWDLVNVIVGQ